MRTRLTWIAQDSIVRSPISAKPTNASSRAAGFSFRLSRRLRARWVAQNQASSSQRLRSEEHTSELQSHVNLVCRLLLEKKKKNNTITHTNPSTTPHNTT